MGTKHVGHEIDDWGIMKQIIPGLEPAILGLAGDLTGEPLVACTGAECDRGYREGTRWMHFFGISDEVFEQLIHAVEIMSFSYRTQIEEKREEIKSRIGN